MCETAGRKELLQACGRKREKKGGGVSSDAGVGAAGVREREGGFWQGSHTRGSD